MTVPLVIIRYLNVRGIFVFPPEADSILVIDTDAVLALAISPQLLQTIARRKSEIFNSCREADGL